MGANKNEDVASDQQERRTSPRHRVNGSAVIHLVQAGCAIRGRILDLSLGGCHIRTGTSFPKEVYTRVEAEFSLEGAPFRLGGIVQGFHDREHRDIGIRFLDLSERKRKQVEDLILEIEEIRAHREKEFQSQNKPPAED